MSGHLAQRLRSSALGGLHGFARALRAGPHALRRPERSLRGSGARTRTPSSPTARRSSRCSRATSRPPSRVAHELRAYEAMGEQGVSLDDGRVPRTGDPRAGAQRRGRAFLRNERGARRAGTTCSTQMMWRGIAREPLPRATAGRRGALAREAVAIAESTDFLSYRGDALIDLAAVLEAAGRTSEASDAVVEAASALLEKGCTSLQSTRAIWTRSPLYESIGRRISAQLTQSPSHREVTPMPPQDNFTTFDPETLKLRGSSSTQTTTSRRSCAIRRQPDRQADRRSRRNSLGRQAPGRNRQRRHEDRGRPPGGSADLDDEARPFVANRVLKPGQRVDGRAVYTLVGRDPAEWTRTTSKSRKREPAPESALRTQAKAEAPGNGSAGDARGGTKKMPAAYAVEQGQAGRCTRRDVRAVRLRRSSSRRATRGS